MIETFSAFFEQELVKIINNINSRKINIGIIGLGYVGLPLAVRFSEERFQVVGFDIDADKVNILNAGNSFIKHISEEKISDMVETGFIATDNFSKISDYRFLVTQNHLKTYRQF